MEDGKQIVINPSIIATLGPVLLRQIVYVGGGFVMLLGLFERRDLAGFYTWIQGEDFITFLTTAAVLACMAYGHLRTFWNKVVMVTLGDLVDDAVAIVKRADPPPAVTDVTDASGG
jgi:hypothetical protein